MFLGMLEEIPGHYVGQSASRGVRVLFRKDGSGWRPFPSDCADQACLRSITSMYPQTVEWNIGFSGRSLGHLKASTPGDFGFYSDIGLQRITTGASVPNIGGRRKSYGGFLGTPVLRPLVANSLPRFSDPDSWHPAKASDAVSAELRLQFRRRFPTALNCVHPNDGGTPGPWKYRDADIRLARFYASDKGWSVAQVLLWGYRCDAPAGDEFIDQWFAVAPDGKVRYLGAGMWLVDAGDYDNDGRSEVIFSIDRYNRGGYELFYDGFRRHATFEFGYH